MAVGTVYVDTDLCHRKKKVKEVFFFNGTVYCVFCVRHVKVKIFGRKCAAGFTKILYFFVLYHTYNSKYI